MSTLADASAGVIVLTPGSVQPEMIPEMLQVGWKVSAIWAGNPVRPPTNSPTS